MFCKTILVQSNAAQTANTINFSRYTVRSIMKQYFYEG